MKSTTLMWNKKKNVSKFFLHQNTLIVNDFIEVEMYVREKKITKKYDRKIMNNQLMPNKGSIQMELTPLEFNRQVDN